MKARYYLTLVVAPIILMLSGCDIKNKRTTIEIIDAERHYHSILRGQVLDVIYQVMNTGKNPLFINNIKTSCGCILIDKSSFKVLPSGGKGFIRIQYDSSKNIGYVKHYVTIFANLEADQPIEASFDLHVVPSGLYTRDYEEIYSNKNPEKTLVDGQHHEKGYYMGDTPW